MRQSVDFNSADFGLRTETRARRDQADSGKPFRIIVLGDFSGRSAGAAKPREIDPDNFDDVIAALAPVLKLPVEEEEEIRFRALDDFHPDSLYRQVREFRPAVKEPFLRAQKPPEPRTEESKPAVAAPPPPPRSSGNILDDMLNMQSGAAAVSAAPARRDEFEDVIRAIVRPHLAPAPHAAAAEYARLEQVYDSELMRALLRDPEFRALETPWRTLDFFIRRVPTGGDIRMAILDVRRADLSPDLLKRVLGGFDERYSLAVALYDFGPDETAFLASIAEVAAAAGAPFIAGARPEMLGRTTFADLEQARNLRAAPEFATLRTSEHASCIALALPRFLLREPYGPKTSGIDSFDFTEIPETPAHKDYLWGNSAMAAALVLARAFERGGWEELTSSIDPEVDGLPVHTWGPSTDPEMMPCAETWMTEELAVTLMDSGFIAFASLKHRDAIRLLRLQSISEQSPRLAGPWQ